MTAANLFFKQFFKKKSYKDWKKTNKQKIQKKNNMISYVWSLKTAAELVSKETNFKYKPFVLSHTLHMYFQGYELSVNSLGNVSFKFTEQLKLSVNADTHLSLVNHSIWSSYW